MDKRYKLTACATAVLAVLFLIFFQASKHAPSLSSINPFVDDPYDAVGSFGVELAALATFVSLVRAFRPCPRGAPADNATLFLLRGELVVVMAVAVTLAADGVAMLRYPQLWMGTAAGPLLAAWLVGMAVLAAVVGRLVYRPAPYTASHSSAALWVRASVASIASVFILLVYPVGWRQAIPGEIFTVVVGAAVLLVPVWAWVTAISPWRIDHFEDFVDDISSIHSWLKACSGTWDRLSDTLRRMLQLPIVRPVLCWLNSRRHAWNFAVLLGLLIGLLAAIAEGFSEGGTHQIGRFAMVAAIFVGLEFFAVLLGYWLLAKPLGLFRPLSE